MTNKEFWQETFLVAFRSFLDKGRYKGREYAKAKEIADSAVESQYKTQSVIDVEEENIYAP